MSGWFWRRRDHGYRHSGRLGDPCRRCGNVEYHARHPRGMWVMAPWRSPFGPLFR